MRNLITLLLITSCQIVSSQSLVIEPSRISGTAPLYVFFDATGSTGLDGVNDLPNADFSWNFDVSNNDPSGNWEITKGMVAGHVFEEPGTYTISCTMIARNGTVDTKEVEIVVSEFDGTTYYVAADGNDANDGLSEGSPWQTANFAFDQITVNTRLLFNRGDSFSEVRYTIRNLGESGIRIGAYGSGEKPQLVGQFNLRILGINNTQDIAVSDIHFINTGDFSDTYGALDMQDSVNHSLVLRCEVEGSFNSAVYSDKNDQIGIFDCHFHDFEFRSLFSIDTRRMSFVGNNTDNIGGVHHQSHGIRVQRGEKQFVAHNTFSNLFQTKTGMTFRGDGQKHVMIYNNKLDRIIQVAPTSFQEVHHISLVTLEGNYIGQNPAYDGADVSPSQSAINIIASEVVVRNNVLDGMRRGVFVNSENIEVGSSDVDIYHNTMNWRPVAENSGSSGVFARVDDTENAIVRNNLMTASSDSEMQILSDNDNTNLIESNNLATVTPNFASGSLPNSQADENDAANYKLTQESPAVNQGALDVPVYFDQTGVKRYYGSAPDVGAFEFNDGGDIVNPDPSDGQVVLGISDIEFLKIYPNPVSRVLILEDKYLGQSLSITSFTGVEFIQISKLKDTEIDISNIPNGLYLLKIEGNEKIVSRFIKN